MLRAALYISTLACLAGCSLQVNYSDFVIDCSRGQPCPQGFTCDPARNQCVAGNLPPVTDAGGAAVEDAGVPDTAPDDIVVPDTDPGDTQPCVSDCESAGEVRCKGNSVQECRQNAPTCFQWVVKTNCEGENLCRQGRCVSEVSLRSDKAELNFGDIQAGGKAEQKLVVTNASNVDVTLESTEVPPVCKGVNVDAGGLPAPIPSGATKEIKFTFEPVEPQAFVLKDCIVRLNHTGPDSPLEISLSGRVVGKPTAVIQIDNKDPVNAKDFRGVGDHINISGAKSASGSGRPIVRYNWAIKTAPQGSTVTAPNDKTANNFFITYDVPGNYVIELVVEDAANLVSDPVQVGVTVYNKVQLKLTHSSNGTDKDTRDVNMFFGNPLDGEENLCSKDKITPAWSASLKVEGVNSPVFSRTDAPKSNEEAINYFTSNAINGDFNVLIQYGNDCAFFADGACTQPAKANANVVLNFNGQAKFTCCITLPEKGARQPFFNFKIKDGQPESQTVVNGQCHTRPEDITRDPACGP
ncbi:MAG: hypothetical protein GMKNLPBB_02530 [Myxococcota bacterium]|nr:hypothetical protein [Myxococcota bacterium]